jgi:hypothetical protein
VQPLVLEDRPGRRLAASLAVDDRRDPEPLSVDEGEQPRCLALAEVEDRADAPVGTNSQPTTARASSPASASAGKLHVAAVAREEQCQAARRVFDEDAAGAAHRGM